MRAALDACKLHAHTADHELATAIRGAVGDIPLDATGSAPGGAPSSPGQPNPAAGGKPKTWQDMLLPTGAGDGDPARMPQSAEDALMPAGAGGPGGKPPSLEHLLTGRGQPSGPGGQQPGSLSDMLGALAPPGAVGAPAPQLKPAEVEAFRAMARKTMADAGMPPDQIEATSPFTSGENWVSTSPEASMTFYTFTAGMPSKVTEPNGWGIGPNASNSGTRS